LTIVSFGLFSFLKSAPRPLLATGRGSSFRHTKDGNSEKNFISKRACNCHADVILGMCHFENMVLFNVRLRPL
jgi:hypothetical protein